MPKTYARGCRWAMYELFHFMLYEEKTSAVKSVFFYTSLLSENDPERQIYVLVPSSESFLESYRSYANMKMVNSIDRGKVAFKPNWYSFTTTMKKLGGFAVSKRKKVDLIRSDKSLQDLLDITPFSMYEFGMNAKGYRHLQHFTSYNAVVPSGHLHQYELNCEQVSDDIGPLVPPDGYSISDFRQQLEETRKLRKFVNGALYDGMNIESSNWHVISMNDIKKGRHVLKVKNESTTVEVMDVSGDIELMDSLRRMVGTIKTKHSNCRKEIGDRGWMVAFGRRRGGKKRYVRGGKRKGKVWQYELMSIMKNNKQFAATVAEASRQMRRFVEKNFNKTYTEMATQEKKFGIEISPEMGGVDGLTASGVISVDLGNASHVDKFDGSNSISVWLEKIPGQARGWYFLLPNVHVDGDPRPIAIELFNGIAIKWDGRTIRHCSSVPDCGAGNHVYGNYWAATCN
jgi:hypothetical protein